MTIFISFASLRPGDGERWTDHPNTVNMRLLRNFLRSVRWFTLDPRPHRACLVIMERSYQLEGSLRSA